MSQAAKHPVISHEQLKHAAVLLWLPYMAAKPATVVIGALRYSSNLTPRPGYVATICAAHTCQLLHASSLDLSVVQYAVQSTLHKPLLLKMAGRYNGHHLTMQSQQLQHASADALRTPQALPASLFSCWQLFCPSNHHPLPVGLQLNPTVSHNTRPKPHSALTVNPLRQ
jgi:hypothetical protein